MDYRDNSPRSRKGAPLGRRSGGPVRRLFASRRKPIARTSQVNELLTWLDRHPLPVVAATNHAQRLDPATLRRFVFKLELRALSGTKVEQAFVRFFGMGPPASLASLRGITPGDLAVVARQLRHDPARDGHEIVTRLKAELAAKHGSPQPIGF
jgi:hypothetical protein